MKIDKVEFSGLIVLFIGVILLAFTFFSAYSFLTGILTIPGSQNLVGFFGVALAPLIEAIIRILYLGIMGWLGSILTIRAVQLLKKEKTEITPSPQPSVKPESKQATKQEPQPQPEVKEAKTSGEKSAPAKVKEAEKTETPENPKPADKPEGTTAQTSAP